ncbi:MAG TPA: beta-ketoacyl-[acyl-carrier-protein] synthase family protein [Planctomycetota bacterium]|nr:beta-ketoacyl-[acyl-carrier-protein] synthase family protein [Planctomycetota bacterium]
MDRRIVITGMGVFSPVGIGVDTYWQSLVSGTSGVRPITRFQVGDFALKMVAEVPEFKPRDYIPKEQRKSLKVMSWDVKLGVAAAMSAVEDARIIVEGKRVDPTRLGISFGAGNMMTDLDEVGSSFAAATREGSEVDLCVFGPAAMQGFFPLWLLKYLPNMPACHVSIFCGAEGPSNSVTTGDAASLQALGEGCRAIERGAADVMICGGVDAKIHPVCLTRYMLMGATTTTDTKPEEMSRPFEKSRDGFVPGEGAAAVVIEEHEHAKARGATILAEIRGFGGGCDAYAPEKIEPEGRGTRQALQNALRDATLDAGDVDAVFACANGSVEGDRAESRAIAAVFGDGPDAVPVTSTRSMIGYISAAGGLLDVVAAVRAIADATIPPTINYDEPDPECSVNVVGNTALKKELRNVMVSSGGFGGQHAAILVSGYRE